MNHQTKPAPRAKWKIIARHKWIAGATITESSNQHNDHQHRFTATIHGYRNWKILECDCRAINNDARVKLVRDIANQTQSAIIVVHHTNRNGKSKGGNYRGSSAIKGALDAMVAMESVQDANGLVAKIETTKQRDGRVVTKFARATFKEFVDENNPSCVVPSFEVKVAKEQDYDLDARHILDVVDNEKISISEIEKRLAENGFEIQRTTLKKKLARLIKAGALLREGELKGARYYNIDH